MALTASDREFLKGFFRSVNFEPIDPTDDAKYVPIYSDPELASDLENDPVLLLGRAIEWTPGETVQLFSGFRGTGKSTELRRLRQHLKDQGYLVVLCDMEPSRFQLATWARRVKRNGNGSSSNLSWPRVSSSALFSFRRRFRRPICGRAPSNCLKPMRAARSWSVQAARMNSGLR
jgi:hypothetical protein